MYYERTKKKLPNIKNRIFNQIEKAFISLSPIPLQGHAKKRLTCLCGLVSGMIKTKSSQLSKIGTGLPQDIDAKSRETSAKRFLENKHTDYDVHYLPYFGHLLASILSKSDNSGRLHLVVDSSQMGAKHVTLWSVLGKRAIPLIWVVKKGKKGHFSVEMHLEIIEKVLGIIRSLVPENTPITLLGNGEFDSVALQKCCRETLNIDYVFRTSSDAIMFENGDKFQAKNIKLTAKQKSLFIASVEFSNEKF